MRIIYSTACFNGCNHTSHRGIRCEHWHGGSESSCNFNSQQWWSTHQDQKEWPRVLICWSQRMLVNFLKYFPDQISNNVVETRGVLLLLTLLLFYTDLWWSIFTHAYTAGLIIYWQGFLACTSRSWYAFWLSVWRFWIWGPWQPTPILAQHTLSRWTEQRY